MGSFTQNSLQSKADQTSQISKSVYVSNFLDGCTARDLWKACNDYGTVVDIFISVKKSKAGKRFAFVRFIKVCFARPPRADQSSHPPKQVASGSPSFVSAVKGPTVPFPYGSSSPALVLDDSCEANRDLGNCVIGEVKRFSSINNLCVLLSNEGFNNMKLAYLGGLWVMIDLHSSQVKAKFMSHVGVASWFGKICSAQLDFVSRERIVWVDIEGVPLHAWSRESFCKIESKWGEVIDLEETLDDCFARKRICIKTKQEDGILKGFKIIIHDDESVKGRDEVNDGSCNHGNSDAASDVEEISDTVFGDTDVKNDVNHDQVFTLDVDKPSPDPFNIYDLLNKKNDRKDNSDKDSSLPYPPGFTPNSEPILSDDHKANAPSDYRELNTGGSILYVLDIMINIVHTMGYNMKGCVKDMEKIIACLSTDQALDLELAVSNDEILRAVWHCGNDKSPGPDGFTFEFFRAFWNIIGPDFCLAVDWFFQHHSFAKGCNSSFVALIPKINDPKIINDYRPISLIGNIYKVVIKVLANRLSTISDIISDVQSAFLPNRQILYGPFIINELLSWCKHKKKQIMMFKVDFAKAYDSVRWDYLDDVLRCFGFGSKWRSWISGSLNSGMASILVNGSPTAEFPFHCGLKQGDQLAPFLFILIMESFHLSFIRVVEAGLFKGIQLGSSLSISHLFYADDAVFIGFKINIMKSNLLGVGVSREAVSIAARNIGRLVMSTPFKYLGVMVGGNMSLTKSWVGKLKSRLSKWKQNTLSIGGRLTLLKSVLGSTPIYDMPLYKTPKSVLHSMESIRRKFFYGANDDIKKITWISWSKVLAVKDKGGLGVSSLYGLNRALLFKWSFPRMYALENSKDCYVADKFNGSLLGSFRRIARGGIEEYQLSQLRLLLEPAQALKNISFVYGGLRSCEENAFFPSGITCAQGLRFRPTTSRFEAWNEENVVKMASALAKLVASKLLSIRSVSSSSRFYNTKAFQGRGSGRNRDGSERVQRGAMVDVTGVVKNQKGLNGEDLDVTAVKVEWTFQTPDPKYLQKKVIVCPKNETAYTINACVLSLINHEHCVYLSSDEATPLYQNEYLNTLKFVFRICYGGKNFPPILLHRMRIHDSCAGVFGCSVSAEKYV
nr:RNA-directed DNA polymerase, eukaryota [Tanacetum cinerariifolium]